MPESNEVKPEGEWIVVTPGRSTCQHKWKYDVNFVYHARERQCERKLCREKQIEKSSA